MLNQRRKRKHKLQPKDLLGLNPRDRLILEYQDFVEEVANRLIKARGLPRGLKDEFVSAGYLGLVEAAERFDFSSGNNFKQYAFLRIRGSIIDSIRKLSGNSGKAYRQAKALQAAHALREELYGEWQHEVEREKVSPSKQSSSDRAAKKLGQILEYASQAVMVFRVDSEVVEAELSEALGGVESPDCRMERIEKGKIIKALVKKLPSSERRVIQQFYYQEKTFSEIVKENKDLSKSWVSRLHRRGLSHLKESYLDYLEKERV